MTQISKMIASLLMKAWRGSRLQGLVIKVLVVSGVAAGFRVVLHILILLDKQRFPYGSARLYLIDKPMAAMTFAEPILWVWFLVVPLFGVLMMYTASYQKPEERRSGSH